MSHNFFTVLRFAEKVSLFKAKTSLIRGFRYPARFAVGVTFVPSCSSECADHQYTTVNSLVPSHVSPYLNTPLPAPPSSWVGLSRMERQPHTNPDRATSRVAIYEDQALCTKLLDSVTAAAPLQILPSKIAGAGAGLYTTKDVDRGQEIFRSRPVINCVMAEMQALVCDNCYAYKESKVAANGRFCAEESPKLDLKACSGCKACYYCSKVTTCSIKLALIPRRDSTISKTPRTDCL